MTVISLGSDKDECKVGLRILRLCVCDTGLSTEARPPKAESIQTSRVDSLDHAAIRAVNKLAIDEDTCGERASTLVNGRVKSVSERLRHFGRYPSEWVIRMEDVRYTVNLLYSLGWWQWKSEQVASEFTHTCIEE